MENRWTKVPVAAILVTSRGGTRCWPMFDMLIVYSNTNTLPEKCVLYGYKSVTGYDIEPAAK